MDTTKETPVVEEAAVATTDTDAAAAEKQAQDDFDAGVEMETNGTKAPPARDEGGRFVAGSEDKPAKQDAKPAGKEKPGAAAPAAKPKYVQVTEEQFARFEAAVAKSETFEQQFSKAFGTMGDMQKILRNLQAQTPRGAAVKLPPGAFDAMKKDFPELAEHMQTAMESILKGAEGTGAEAADPAAFEKAMEERVLKMADEDLADEFPDWKKIVGAVDTRKGEKPDPNNPFRKWLATKPQEYQDRINSATSAGVITRAIRMFKSDEKAAKAAAGTPPKTQQQQQRQARIAEAVRPQGDGGHPPAPAKEDEFEAGFKSG